MKGRKPAGRNKCSLVTAGSFMRHSQLLKTGRHDIGLAVCRGQATLCQGNVWHAKLCIEFYAVLVPCLFNDHVLEGQTVCFAVDVARELFNAEEVSWLHVFAEL